MSDDEPDAPAVTFVAAHSRLTNGRLVIEEIVGRAGFILAARRARWPAPAVRHLESWLVNSLEVFRQHCNRLEGGQD